MSKMIKTMMATATALLVTGGAAMAAEASIGADVMSAYVWRGQVLNDEVVLQPDFAASTDFGLSFDVWGNMDLTDNLGASGKFSEIDLVAAYTVPMPEDSIVGVDLAVINYQFPQAGGDTTELGATVGFDTFLAPFVAANWDIDAVAGGIYLSAGLGYEQAVDEEGALVLNAAAAIGWGNSDYNKGYFGSDSSAMNDANLSAGASYAVSETVSLGLSVAYSAMIDSDIEDGAEATFGDKDSFYGGLSASYSF